MSADGEVVDVEGLVAIDVVVHTVFDDLGVPGGPGDLAAGGGVHVQAGTELLPGVAQVGMRDLPAIHIVVSVVAQNLIALPAQLLGQREVGVGTQRPGALHGDGVAVFGVEAQQGLTLSV